MRGKAQRVARPAQTRPQNSEATVPKFIRFLTGVDGSSAVLTRAKVKTGQTDGRTEARPLQYASR